MLLASRIILDKHDWNARILSAVCLFAKNRKEVDIMIESDKAEMDRIIHAFAFFLAVSIHLKLHTHLFSFLSILFFSPF